MGALALDRSELLSKPQIQADGSVIYDAVMSRTGVFDYTNDDGTTRSEYRSREEVFSPASMASFDGMAAVYYHRGEVSIENRSKLQVGSIVPGSLRPDGDRLLGKIHVTDADMLSRIKSGMTAVSLGYFPNRIREDGVSPIDGKRYTHRQTDIRGNHIAFVDVARAGDDARIRVDGFNTTGAINMDELKQALAKIFTLETANAKLQMTQDAAGAQTTELTKRLSTVEAERDTLKEKLGAETKLRQDGEAKSLATARARVELENTAAKHLTVDGKAPSFDNKSDRAIRESVIVKITGKDLPAGKDDAYVSARFDMLLEDAAARTETVVAQHTAFAGSLIPAVRNDAKPAFNQDGSPNYANMTASEMRDYNSRMQANKWQTPSK